MHPTWKIIKTETQNNLVTEMYLCMVQGIKKTLAAVISTALLPPFWINADLWTRKVTKANFYGIRRRTRTDRLIPSVTSSTPVVGQHVFVKLHGSFHKAVVKKILLTTDPPMHMCVHSDTSRYTGQV